MMIPVLTDYYREGYLERPPHRTLTVFFPNCNLAIRRDVLRQIGGYDEERNQAAEDADICRRTLDAGWDLFFEPRAACLHESRPRLGGLMRQWFSYGFYSAAFYRKYQEDRCEVFWAQDLRPKVNRYVRLCGTRYFPVGILLFLSGFSIAVFTALLWMATVLIWPTVAALSLGAMPAAFFLALYLLGPARKLRLREGLMVFMITALINLSAMVGSFVGGLRRGMLYHYPGI